MPVEFLELGKVELVTASCYVFPDIFAVTGLEATFEELVHDLFEPIKIDTFVAVLRHISESLISRRKLILQKISNFLTVLRFPVVPSKQPHKIILLQVPFLMLVETVEYVPEHVLIDHEP